MRVINTSQTTDEGTILDAAKLVDIPVLFMVNFKNSELSRTMQQIKNIIDNKTQIKKYDRNTILEAFIDTNIEGGIKLNAVHFEVLLMNQLRALDDIFELPDWSKENEQVQILTLGEALANNQSISIILQSNKIDKALINPANRRIHKPSNMDVYYMEQPQEYISDKDLINDEYKLKNDVENNKIQPIHFMDGDAEYGPNLK